MMEMKVPKELSILNLLMLSLMKKMISKRVYLKRRVNVVKDAENTKIKIKKVKTDSKL